MVTAVLAQTMQTGASSVVASDSSVMQWVSAFGRKSSMTIVLHAHGLDTWEDGTNEFATPLAD